MNNSSGFFLGLIAAVVLFLLWKNQAAPTQASAAPPANGNGTGAGAGGCAGGSCGSCTGPSCSAAPPAQSAVSLVTSGTGDTIQISPGTPPLQGTTGVGSFYAGTGPTGPTSFTNFGTPTRLVNTLAPLRGSPIFYVGSDLGGPVNPVPNVPGSPTTPANQVPVRATVPVESYKNTGVVSQFNVSGVPRTGLRSASYLN